MTGLYTQSPGYHIDETLVGNLFRQISYLLICDITYVVNQKGLYHMHSIPSNRPCIPWKHQSKPPPSLTNRIRLLLLDVKMKESPENFPTAIYTGC